VSSVRWHPSLAVPSAFIFVMVFVWLMLMQHMPAFVFVWIDFKG
jgi:hypothetical protein